MDGTGIEWGGEGARRFYRFSAFLPEAEEPREIPPGMTEIEVRTLANYGLLQSQAAVPSGADRCDGPTVFHADGWFECHGAGLPERHRRALARLSRRRHAQLQRLARAGRAVLALPALHVALNPTPLELAKAGGLDRPRSSARQPGGFARSPAPRRCGLDCAAGAN